MTKTFKHLQDYLKSDALSDYLSYCVIFRIGDVQNLQIFKN